jgi:hypothetical protein
MTIQKDLAIFLLLVVPVQDRFLLQEDADRLIAQAGASVMPTDAESPSQNRDIASALCGPGR